MVDLAVVEHWITIGSSIATILVVYLLWRAVKQMDETVKLSRIQVTHRFRPWVGPSSGIEFMRATPEGKHQFVIKLQNYGELPASNVVANFTMKNEMLSKDTLKSSAPMHSFSLGPLLPNMEKRYWFFVDSDAMKRAKDDSEQIFVALYFVYEFAQGRNGYGMISKFDRSTDSFVHLDMWVD